MLIFHILIIFHIITSNFNKFWAINKICCVFFIYYERCLFYGFYLCVSFFFNFSLKGQYQTSQETKPRTKTFSEMDPKCLFRWWSFF
jgi:hypothetical protein